MPNAVQAVAGRLTKTDISVEDNAAITMIYPSRIVVTEASWSQIPSYHDSVYMGTTGTLWTQDDKMFLADESGQRELPVEALPEGERSGPEYFVTCLDHNRAPADVCAGPICRDAQEVLEAGQRSDSEGRRVMLPL